jgi:membrane protein required for colicin V production
MIWIDYAIIGLVSTALIIGLLRGFSLEVFSLAFWVLATGVGLNFSREFSVFLEATIRQAAPKIAVSFALLFLITLIVGSLIRMLLGEAIKKPQLTVIARLGGMLVGVVHGMVAMVVIVMLAGLTSMPNDLWWAESKLLPPFQLCAVWLRDHIPSELAAYVHYR